MTVSLGLGGAQPIRRVNGIEQPAAKGKAEVELIGLARTLTGLSIKKKRTAEQIVDDSLNGKLPDR
jgi:hypothetical protein